MEGHVNRNPEVKFTKLFINNEFVNSISGKVFPTFNPSTGEKIADVSEGDKADVDLAVEAAAKAFPVWGDIKSSERGQYIRKLADLIKEERFYLANLETLDCGKPVGDSLADIEASVDVLRYYSGWADKIHGETLPEDEEHLVYTRVEPVGVVGQIIPWNYPIMMLAWKWGPALAVGCTVILKPAEQTPLTALYIAHLAKKANFPPGVINVIPGYGPTAGAAITAHPKIDKVAFTGSVQVGKLVQIAAANSNLKRVSLELGGKSPILIFADAPSVDDAVEIASRAAFANHGQNCCAGSRTYVQEEIYDEFVAKSRKAAQAINVADPFESASGQGPQIDETMFNKVLAYIESGKKEGAKLECGGARLGTKGYFIQPTVFSEVQDGMTIAREEIFGPVQSILKFKSFEEAIERANNTNYGLAAGVVTNDINKALLFARNVKAGSVWVNCYDFITPLTPFGGYKQSGFGRELGKEALNEYLEVKTVSIRLQKKNNL